MMEISKYLKEEIDNHRLMLLEDLDKNFISRKDVLEMIQTIVNRAEDVKIKAIKDNEKMGLLQSELLINTLNYLKQEISSAREIKRYDSNANMTGKR